MAFRKVVSTLLAAMICLSPLGGEENNSRRRILIHTGHTTPVTAAAALAGDPFLATLGRDGRLLILDRNTLKPVRNHMTGLEDSFAMAIDNNGKTVSILSGSGKPGYRVTAVDAMTGQRLFSRDLPAKPVSQQYSGTGRVLIITLDASPWLLFLDSGSGRELPVMSGLTDRYNLVQLDGDDRNLTAYSPSGAMTLWKNFRLAGSSPRQESTLPELSGITFLGGFDGTWFGARFQNSLVLMNSEQGREIIGIVTPSDPLILSAFEPGNWKAATLTRGKSGWEITGYGLTREGFRQTSAPKTAGLPAGIKPTVMTLDGRMIWLGDAAGNLYRFDPETGVTDKIGLPVLIPLKTLALRDDTLFLTGGRRLITLSSPFVSSKKPRAPADLTRYNYRNCEIPSAATGGFLPIGGGIVLLVTGEGRDSEIISFNGREGTVADTNRPGAEPVSLYGDTGSFHLFTRKKEEAPLFRTTRDEKSLAAVSALSLPGDLGFPFACGSVTGGIRATGETGSRTLNLYAIPDDKPEAALSVPLPFSDIIDIGTDPANGTFFVLGITEGGTALLSFKTTDLYKPSTEAFLPGEKSVLFRITALTDGPRSFLFLSEDRRTIKVFTGGEEKRVLFRSEIPVVDFACHNGLVYLLLAGGELRVRKTEAREDEPDLFEMYHFADGNWLAVSPLGQWVIASPAIAGNPSGWITLY
jgi:outer membrane protein assembly factor BamB